MTVTAAMAATTAAATGLNVNFRAFFTIGSHKHTHANTPTAANKCSSVWLKPTDNLHISEFLCMHVCMIAPVWVLLCVPL